MQKKGKLKLSGTKTLRDKLSIKQTPRKSFVSTSKKIQKLKNKEITIEEKPLKNNIAVRSKGQKGLYKPKPIRSLPKYAKCKVKKAKNSKSKKR